MENKEFFLNCDGTELHCKLEFPKEEKEKYPLFIVVHGFTGHMEEPHIVGLVNTLNECGFAALRIDMFGHGKSGGVFKNHNLLIWVDELIRMIEYAYNEPCFDKIYLAGHSQGGLAIILAAGIMREYISGIIPLSPALSLGDKKKVDEIAGIKNEKRMNLNEVEVKGMPLRTSWYLVNRMINADNYAQSFADPVLLIHGENDKTIDCQCSKDLHEKYPNSKLVIIEGADHGYHEHLPVVLNTVKEFVMSL